MLAADKLQLQSAFKQQATALKEKEFSLHHNNLMTVGTQAAVLAGLDITMLIEFSPTAYDATAAAAAAGGDLGSISQYQGALLILQHGLQVVYYGLIVAAFCANMSVVAHTTSLSVLGGSLALRGPDGSMMVATDVLYSERPFVFYAFGVGLVCTLLSVMVCLWIFLPADAATICWLVTMICARRMYFNHRRVSRTLGFDESQTVDFRDIFEHIYTAASSTSRKQVKGLARTNNKGAHKDDVSTDTSYDDDDIEEGESATRQLTTRSRSPNSVKRRGFPY
jgi:hypothetical protein